MMEIMEEIVSVSLAELGKSSGVFEFEKRFKCGISRILEKHGFMDVSQRVVERYFRATYWELFCSSNDLARHVQAEKYGDKNRVELIRDYGEEDVKGLSEVILKKYGPEVSNYLGC